MNIVKTFSSASTKAVARKLARQITNPKFQIPNGKGAFVIALNGELGSGKTTFVQGFVLGLGIKKRATSPTFIIFRRFAISHSQFANLYHVDAYRIKNPKDLATLEFDAILSNPKNIILIEWAENIKKILPKNTLWVRFRHGKGENERLLTF